MIHEAHFTSKIFYLYLLLMGGKFILTEMESVPEDFELDLRLWSRYKRII